MTRNELIDKCIEIWNNNCIILEQKEDSIADLLMATEGPYSKGKVNKLLNQIEKEGVLVDTVRLWNYLRDKYGDPIED